MPGIPLQQPLALQIPGLTGQKCIRPLYTDIDFDNGVIYLYRSKVSNDDFISMTKRLRTTLLNRQKVVGGEDVFPGRHGGHKTIQNNRALEAAFKRAGLTDVSSHNMRKTFATRLLSRGATNFPQGLE